MGGKEVVLHDCLDSFSERLELNLLGLSEEQFEKIYNDFRADIEFDFVYASQNPGERVFLYHEHPTKPFIQLNKYQQQLANENRPINVDYEILNHLYEATLFMYVACAMGQPNSPVTVNEVDDFKRTFYFSNKVVEFQTGDSSYKITCEVEELSIGEQTFKLRRWYLEGINNTS